MRFDVIKKLNQPAPLIIQVVFWAVLAGFLGGVCGQVITENYLPTDRVTVIQSSNTTPAVIPEIKPVKRFVGVEQDFAVRDAIEQAAPSVVSVGRARAG